MQEGVAHLVVVVPLVWTTVLQIWTQDDTDRVLVQDRTVTTAPTVEVVPCFAQPFLFWEQVVLYDAHKELVVVLRHCTLQLEMVLTVVRLELESEIDDPVVED